MYSTQSHFDPEVVETPQIVAANKGERPRDVKDYDLDSRRTIDRELTEHTIEFMQRNTASGKPFFAYVPFTQTHMPVTPHPDFDGKTGNGAYADMLAEMDFNVGNILDKIDQLGIRDNTIVIWMSENGPEEAPSYFGTAGYWRGHYFTTLEGSLRTSLLIRWPNNIKPGSVTNEIVHITDLLPTFSSAAGYKVPTDRKIDGVDQMPLFTGRSNKSAREGFPAYNGNNMQSYKWRNFKVHFWDQQSMFGSPTKLNVPRIHDLLKDPKELYGFYGGHGEAGTGTEQLSWVLPAVIHQVLQFQQTLQDEPPIPFPAPEPYEPQLRK
jgi:arylsulfatase